MSYFKMPPPGTRILLEGDSITAPPIDWRVGINDAMVPHRDAVSRHLFVLGCNVLYALPNRPMLDMLGSWELAALLMRITAA